MKYNPRRNYLHPVLRPFSDDYPQGNLKTTVQADIDDRNMNISVTFEVLEPSIRDQITKGNALCVAMLYCGSTLYREMLRAGVGSTVTEVSVPTEMLRGDVEVHPSVVATNHLDLPSNTIHEEYGAGTVSIARWNPLATDQTWRFQVKPPAHATKSIFNREIDENLADGEFDIKLNPAEKYINVTANSSTTSGFKKLPERHSLPTVYVSALVEALAELRGMDSETPIDEDGWVSCIRNNLEKLEIDIGNQDELGKHTLFHTAQMLLNKPFLSLTIQETTLDGEED